MPEAFGLSDLTAAWLYSVAEAAAIFAALFPFVLKDVFALLSLKLPRISCFGASGSLALVAHEFLGGEIVGERYLGAQPQQRNN